MGFQLREGEGEGGLLEGLGVGVCDLVFLPLVLDGVICVYLFGGGVFGEGGDGLCGWGGEWRDLAGGEGEGPGVAERGEVVFDGGEEAGDGGGFGVGGEEEDGAGEGGVAEGTDGEEGGVSAAEGFGEVGDAEDGDAAVGGDAEEGLEVGEEGGGGGGDGAEKGGEGIEDDETDVGIGM